MEKKEEVLHLNLHKHQLAVDKIQTFLDKYLKDNSGCIDYIHGEDVLKELSKEEQTIGIELPAMEKRSAVSKCDDRRNTAKKDIFHGTCL